MNKEWKIEKGEKRYITIDADFFKLSEKEQNRGIEILQKWIDENNNTRTSQKVVPVIKDYGGGWKNIKCGNCKNDIFQNQRFCPDCGTKINWQEVDK